MPIVRNMIKAKFGDRIAQVPDVNFAITAVAKGACRYANTINRVEEIEQIEEIPMNIGVEGRQGTMNVFARKGQETPVHWDSGVMQRINATNTNAVLKFYKGPSNHCCSNIFIANYEIKTENPRPTDRFQFHVEIAKSGDMKITAKEITTNTQLPQKEVQCSLRPVDEELEKIKIKVGSFFP